MLPVFELAEQKIREDEILPRHVHLNWTTYDDNCESSLATISAVNGFTSDCAHVQFGPICDYSLGKRMIMASMGSKTPRISIGTVLVFRLNKVLGESQTMRNILARIK